MWYAIASTECVPRPPSQGIVTGAKPLPTPRDLSPAGVLHATVLGTSRTACGIAVEHLHVFDTLDWEATLVGGGRCPACAVAIDHAE